MVERTYIIAELSANHNQNYELGLRTIEAMAKAGADAVKVQTFNPDTITIDSDAKPFIISGGTPWDGQKLYELYEKTYLPWEWHKPYKDRAEKLGMDFFSSPFDETAVDFLDELDVPCFKIASPELIDLKLVAYTASKGKPVIISTGVATLEDIQEVLSICRDSGNENITLLKCTSNYPAPVDQAHLLTIPDMKKRFGVKVGLSDHTHGSEVAIASVALGAEVIEKHFKLDESVESPDSSFSMTAGEFSDMVQSIRKVEKALGKVDYSLNEKGYKRSLFVVEDIGKGEKFTNNNVKSIRPGGGLPPKYLDKILGMRATADLDRGTPLHRKHVSGKKIE